MRIGQLIKRIFQAIGVFLLVCIVFLVVYYRQHYVGRSEKIDLVGTLSIRKDAIINTFYPEKFRMKSIRLGIGAVDLPYPGAGIPGFEGFDGKKVRITGTMQYVPPLPGTPFTGWFLVAIDTIVEVK